MPKKYEVLAFLDKGAMPPLWEARVLIYFGAQEYPNVTEYAVGPIEQPMYMRKLNHKVGPGAVVGIQTHVQSRVCPPLLYPEESHQGLTRVFL